MSERTRKALLLTLRKGKVTAYVKRIWFDRIPGMNLVMKRATKPLKYCNRLLNHSSFYIESKYSFMCWVRNIKIRNLQKKYSHVFRNTLDIQLVQEYCFNEPYAFVNEHSYADISKC